MQTLDDRSDFIADRSVGLWTGGWSCRWRDMAYERNIHIYVCARGGRGAKLPTADNNPEIERYGNGDTCIPLFTTPARNLTSNFTLPFIRQLYSPVDAFVVVVLAGSERGAGKVWSCKRVLRVAKPNSQRWEFATKLNCKQMGRRGEREEWAS